MHQEVVAVVGLGYVGLPLAISLGTKMKTIAFDISKIRINDLKTNHDVNGDLSSDEIEAAKNIIFTADSSDIAEASVFIIAVPTPVDSSNKPDMHYLKSGCEIVGKRMRKGSIVVFESTVYPGATEEDCVPYLEEFSGLSWKADFNVGYSPERINPGDREHTLEKITKIISADSPEALERIRNIYGKVINAGLFEASSIKTAEAAKVIENTQRDLNIALINELSIIFHLMGISTPEVLEAAGTKWNFIPFKPGLVGGHCIGVDPYYLTYKAEQLGYHPEVILAGRRINDGMGKYIAKEIIRSLLQMQKSNYKVNVLGLTFKENVSDIRNSKVVDLIEELNSFGVAVDVFDPMADPEEVEREYGFKLKKLEDIGTADCVVLAVPHKNFLDRGESFMSNYLSKDGCLFDLKGIYRKSKISQKKYWSL